MEVLIAWELSLLHTIQDGATAFGAAFWSFITMFGEAGLFWIALSLILLIPKKTRRCGLSMALALLFGVIVGNGLLKNLVARPRPYDLDPTLAHRLAWGKMTTDFSFPSGHALASFEAATALFCRSKKWGTAALVLAFSVALSRLFLLVHYPTDLLAGAALGILFALLATRLVDKLWKA